MPNPEEGTQAAQRGRSIASYQEEIDVLKENYARLERLAVRFYEFRPALVGLARSAASRRERELFFEKLNMAIWMKADWSEEERESVDPRQVTIDDVIKG